MATNDTIGIDHWDDLEDKKTPQKLGQRIICIKEEINSTFDSEAGGCLSGVDSGCEKDNQLVRLEPEVRSLNSTSLPHFRRDLAQETDLDACDLLAGEYPKSSC